MNCLVCCQSENGICVEDALDIIKKHYLFLKNDALRKQSEIDLLRTRNEKLQKKLDLFQRTNIKEQEFRLLQERNEKLTKAVALLQRESQKNENQPPKRRKTNSMDFSMESINIDASLSEDDESSKLNMALNSEGLLDSTVSNISMAKTDDNDVQMKAQNTKSANLLRDHNDNDNVNSSSIIAKMTESVSTTKQNSWLSKKCDSPTFSTAWNEPKSTGGNVSATKSVLKKVSLSLNSNINKKCVKLKQTRLQFEGKREKSPLRPNDVTFSAEFIEASPHTASSNKNQTRSLLQRSNNSVANLEVNKSKVQLENPIDDDNIAELTDTNSIKKAVVETAKKTEMELPIAPELPREVELPFEFELREDDEPVMSLREALLEFSNEKANDTSVLMLTPAPQEIVFLDDTCNNTTNIIDSMDLMQNVMQTVETGMAKLKRLETATIKQLQTAAKQHTDTVAVSTKETVKVKQSNSKATTSTTEFKIKQEPKSQPLTAPPNEPQISDNEAEKETDSEDEFMVRPIILKAEQKSPKKISIKELYNIDCDDCQKYLDFVGHRMTAKEIEQHLRNCIRHKKRDVYIAATPEGFWNPFIESFAENDPRNEVLVDNRFVNKKPKT